VRKISILVEIEKLGELARQQVLKLVGNK